ncbi:hypothetical protein [Desulfococcus sp.]|uniref:hypothetical protein n=1 Tax=Desulfococcus sp. TaxID=2025834 RepID=UPI003594543F
MIHLTDPTLMLKQWAEIQDNSLKNALNAVELLHKRAEKMAGQLWEQSVWASEKISDTMMDWGNVYQTGYENLQKVMVPACMMTPKTAPSASDTPETDSTKN